MEKEVTTMDINKILLEYDALEATHDFGAIEAFLLNHLDEAQQAKENDIAFTLYNELIGFYREISSYENSISACRDLLILMDEMGIAGTVPYATGLLNIANACRAAGLLKESMVYYTEVIRIYDEQLEPTDYAYAPLYNNMALLFQEMGDFESAIGTLRKALGLAIAKPNNDIHVAISHTNLALSLLKNDEYGEAIENLTQAFAIFDALPEPDYHYGAALSAMAEAKYHVGEYEESAHYYELALAEVKKNTGYSQAYDITLSNLHQASMKALEQKEKEAEEKGEPIEKLSGLQISEAYYQQYGKQMIHDKFPEYEDKIAVGLCGEGSECLGYDDDTSYDHDFGPGFCMWLPDDVYDEIGHKLEEAYLDMPVRFMGVTRLPMPQAGKRLGVFRIGEWYDNILQGYIGMAKGIIPEEIWMSLEDENLCKATNGKVFSDPLGESTRIRNVLLGYYPNNVWLKKIARELTLVSQYGQYNYERMFKRGDTLAAQVCLGNFLEHALKLTYLLYGKYAPFYKWLSRGAEDIDIFIKNNLVKISENMNDFEGNKKAIEEIALDFVGKLKKLELTSMDSTYLDHHTGYVLSHVEEEVKASPSETEMSREELIDTMVKLEWQAFDKVINEGGRADCQDNWNTFSIMRKSQYMTWTNDMLVSYINDFTRANASGWNLITEKYGRMEESTAPERWMEIKDQFPPVSEEKKAIIETIVAMQVGMMEEFAAKFPKASSNARSIHTSEDNPYNTSYETYLRGEISTYSDETLILYGRFLANLAAEGKNLAGMIIENTAKLYGYETLEKMEELL